MFSLHVPTKILALPILVVLALPYPVSATTLTGQAGEKSPTPPIQPIESAAQDATSSPADDCNTGITGDSQIAGTAISGQATRQLLQQLLSPELAAKRNAYRQAMAELEKNGLKDPRSYKQYRKQLKGYPLLPYLEYQRLRKDIRNTSMSEIDSMFKEEEDAHFAMTLRTQRMDLFQQRGRWRDYLDYYDTVSDTPDRQCLKALAQYRVDNREEALELATRLWLTPKSMPKSCDTIFYILQQENLIDSDLAWQRYIPAFANGEITLARYLTRFLNSAHFDTSEKIQLWYSEPLRLKQDWQAVSSTLQAIPDISETHKKDILLQLIRRLVRVDEDAAIKVVARHLSSPASTGLPEELHNALRSEASDYIIQRYALRDYNKLPTLHRELGQPNSERSWEWLLRSHIARAEWRQLYEALQTAPESIRSLERWQYWSLRARQIDSTLSDEELQSFSAIAREPSFYGFAASHALSQAGNIEPESYPRSPELLKGLLENIHIRRAIEHFAQSELLPARRDWSRALASLQENELLEAAYLAADLGWHSQAISTAAQAQAWRHYGIRFPDIYRDEFRQQAFRYQQNPQWFYATARQESALSETAQSSAGAVGLMQILPTTARQVAREIQTPYSRAALENAGYSINLGTAYLDELYQRYQNRAVSSAAYNAGPHRVDKWLKNLRAELPLDAWIETIRFSETRQYVQNVLSFGLIHFQLHEQDEQSVLWPAFAFFPENETSVKPYARQVNAR